MELTRRRAARRANTRWCRWAVATVPLLGLVGCGEDRYDVAVSWAMNALAPSADVCDRYGVDVVRLTISDGARTRTIDGECTRSLVLTDGYEYGGFVTTDSFDYEVIYPFTVSMIDSRGDPIAGLETRGTFVAYHGDITPVELPTLEIFDPVGDAASVVGRFSFEAGSLAQACEEYAVDRVELWAYSALDYDLVDPEAVLQGDCEAGVLDSGDALLNIGEYQISYVALSSEDEVIQATEPQGVLVDAEGEVQLARGEFEIP